jgi:CRISPR-associated protein Csb2
MPPLTIGWEYLTGYAVATDPSRRERAEWPPHPARVFMAMAAAWFETGQDDREGDALRWLERLGDPEMYLPSVDAGGERTKVQVYVPVNDKAGPAAATLQSAPTLTRSKQARTFPRRYIGHSPCLFHWPGADGLEDHREALDRLCARVTRIGHSSSLVRMWASDSLPSVECPNLQHWGPDDAAATLHCRRFTEGLLDSLPEQTQIRKIERFAQRIWAIEDAQRTASETKSGGDAAAKRAANQRSKEAKKSYEDQLGVKYKKSASPPARLRPKVGLWTGYRLADPPDAISHVGHSHFDTDLLVLTQVDGARLPVVSALEATRALRGAVMQQSGVQPVPPWVSGHRPDGSPSEDEAGHLAVLPLPFVGHVHADGSLLGVALAFPRGVERRERGRVIGPLLVENTGRPCEVKLRLGRLGVWVLRKRDWSEVRKTLTPETWTAHPAGKTTWASVTPVVLDRFPKSERRDPKQRASWEQEVRAIVAGACDRIGLPQPVLIDIGTTSWHVGSPRAIAKRRPLRQGNPNLKHRNAGLGDGFPFFPSKGTNAPRPQTHVFLQFAEPVVGPLLMGAGRYQGYGLFKPLEER